jgi:hypothetical protein
VDVQVHPGRAAAEPLDEQPGFRAVERGAVVFGVSVEPGQRLAGSCAPERQLAVVIGSRDINHDLGQPAVVTHPVNPRGLAVAEGLHQPHVSNALEPAARRRMRTRSSSCPCLTASTRRRSSVE